MSSKLAQWYSTAKMLHQTLDRKQKLDLLLFILRSKLKQLTFAKKSALLILLIVIIWQIREKWHQLKEKILRGQVVVITGAGSGIGRLLSLKLAQEGCRLALWDINFQMCESVASEIHNTGGDARAYSGDVSDNIRVYELAEMTKQDFGRVDILINNAGIVTGKSLLQASDEMLKKTVMVNTVAHFWTVKAFLPEMLERNHGHIVTIASLAGTIGVAGLEDYCASKFGAFGFTESLRNQIRKLGKYGVRTTCVCPYYINTGMFDGVSTPLLPILQPDWVVNKIVTAMKRDQEVLMLPRSAYWGALVRCLLPTSLFDAICSVSGVHYSMDTFKGNSISVPRGTPPQ